MLSFILFCVYPLLSVLLIVDKSKLILISEPFPIVPPPAKPWDTFIRVIPGPPIGAPGGGTKQ